MLPESVKVGAHTFRIMPLPEEADQDEWGEADFVAGTISVAEKVPPSRQTEVVLHEVIHALLLGWEMKEEEAITTLLGEGIAAFLQDNPQFVKHVCDHIS